MKQNKKIITLAIIVFFCISGILIHFNLKKQEETISINANLMHVVTLEENNCKTSTENDVTILEQYTGSADKVIIEKEIIEGDSLKINSDAFLQCDNLDSILIDKSLVNENLKIPNFEINEYYEDEQYVEYTSTQEYSEAYQRYLELTEEERSQLEVIPSKYDIPMSVLYTESMEENYGVSSIETASIPTSYDLRSDIDIEVENQGRTGICYSYASLTAVETNLALNHNQYTDLSEVHQAMMTGGYGGTFILASNSYYSDNIGPVYENEWPMTNLTSATRSDLEKNIYTHLSTSTDYLVGDALTEVQEILKQTNSKLKVTETVYMPTISKSKNYSDKQITEARNTIKTHIMNYGSLYASVASKALIKGTSGYVMNSSNAYNTDHGVSLVGWDDNYAKENFPESCRPENNGAYLALNSWGETWGSKGYFWISYEDYWTENNLRGVVTVETTQDAGMNIENVTVTDIDTNEDITDNIIKGSNIQVKISTIINKLIGGKDQVTVSIISPSGEDITDEVVISGDTVQDYKATVLFNLNTSELEIGDYTVNIQYEGSSVSQTFTINPNTFDFYIKDDGTIVITKYYGEDKELIIPDEFLGFSVTEIESEAFKENNLQSVTINENIMECGNNIIRADVIIYGKNGTYIQEYANKNGYTFISTQEDLVVEIGTNGDTTWKNKHQTIVTVAGDTLDETSLKYQWAQSNDTIDENEFSNTFINGQEISISDCTGEYYLWILAKDRDGNKIIVCSNVFYLDNKEPTTGTLAMNLESSDGEKYINDTWTSENVYISVNNGEDQHSGHKSTVYSINGGIENTNPQVLTESGVYDLVVTTTDNVGNISTKLYTIKIRRVQALEIITNPSKMEYVAYESFKSDGMVVSLIYDNGEIEEISDYTIINGEELTCESDSVIIQYNDTITTTLEGIIVGHAEVIDEGVEATCTQTGLTEGSHCSVCNEVIIAQTEISAKGHTEVIDEGKEATCTEKGLTEGSHCSVCSEVIIAQKEIPAKGHTEVVEIAVEATCTKEGLTSGKYCSICNEVLAEQEIIPAKGHTEVIDEGREATCTETGLTEGKHCSVCNEVLGEQEIIPAKGHTEIIDEAVEATCTEKGLTEGKHCSVCNEVIVAQKEIPAKGHTEIIDEAVEATCTETGLTEGKHCSVCNEVIIAQTEISAKGHTEVIDEGREATCTEKGLTEGSHCSVCSEVIIAQKEIPAKGHTEVVEIAVEATCTKEGLTSGKYCSICNEVLAEQEIIPAKGHTEVIDERREATCTEKGLTEGKHCSVCNEVIIAQTEILAKGHTEVIDEGVEATCTQTGLTEGSHCSVCSEVIIAQKEIPAKGHTEVVEIAVEATCTKEGLTSGKYCSICNEVLAEQEIIPAKGHTEVIDGGKEATCTEKGLTEGSHCSVCNEVIIAQTEILAKGHTEVIDGGKEATCTEKGLTEGSHCSVCNEVIIAQTEIPARGHTAVIDEAVEATCTETGLTEGKHCSVCNTMIVAQEEVPAKGHEFINYTSDENATCTENGTKTAKCNRCDEKDTKVDEGSKLSHNYENGECINCSEKQSMIKIESEEYKIEDEQIAKIQEKTTVDQFKHNIETNATEINIYNKKGELLDNNNIIATGMQLQLKLENETKNFTIVISGDVNEDGEADIFDMIIINWARLKRKTLEGANFIAADVTGDGKVEIKDLVKINRFRLHKITEL